MFTYRLAEFLDSICIFFLLNWIGGCNTIPDIDPHTLKVCGYRSQLPKRGHHFFIEFRISFIKLFQFVNTEPTNRTCNNRHRDKSGQQLSFECHIIEPAHVFYLHVVLSE